MGQHGRGAGKRVAVFLDRDGTINEDPGYLSSPDGLVLLPGALRALKRAQDAGFLLIVVSNQSGLSRGYFTREVLDAIHERLREKLGEGGVRLDEIYYCPHHPDEGCACRKPSSLFVMRAAEKYGLDLSRSYVVGDRESDIQMGINAGCRTVLIRSAAPGAGGGETAPDFVAGGIGDAIEWILGDSGRGGGAG